MDRRGSKIYHRGRAVGSRGALYQSNSRRYSGVLHPAIGEIQRSVQPIAFVRARNTVSKETATTP